MINALNEMPASENLVSGENGIGVLMGNSLMFQRFPTHDSYDDPQFSNFYGQTLPLLKRGIPVQTVHMENLGYQESLKDIKVLIVSYSNMKPSSEEVHENLKKWVKNGGILVFTGRDEDPYQEVMEWWNQNGNKFQKPSENLFKMLGLAEDLNDGSYKVGEGRVFILRKDPKEFILKENQDKEFVETIETAFESLGKKLSFTNHLSLQRGPYKIIAVMDESVSDELYFAQGPVVDLFDPRLPVLSQKNRCPR